MLMMQILFIFYIIKQRNCVDNLKDNISNINDTSSFKITQGIVETKYIYKSKNPFTFFVSNDYNYDEDLIMNFYSINCNININIHNKNDASDKSQDLPNLIGHDKDIYSLKISKNEIKNMLINIEPLNNDYYYNYNRTCPLIINSFVINEKFPLNINEKEPIYLSFNGFSEVYLSYKLNNINKDSFVALLFTYHENANFTVIVSDNNNKIIIGKTLDTSDSNNIFLTNELQNIKELFIYIKLNTKYINSDMNQALLKLEIKTNNSPPLILEKNYINKGLITSNLEYRHYYFEVFNGEGGEIILHDKRQSGILIGSIIPKKNFKDKINNSDIYPKINSPIQGRPLNYDKHFLKLYFNFNDTELCNEGCYILISYYHEKFATKNNEIIGFEFTLLFRIWDDKEFQSQIINIPLNEYVFGFFEEESVKRHYYSFYIPDQYNNFCIQLQGQNYKGFHGRNKRKINENLIWHNVEKFINLNNKDIVCIETEYRNDYISFLMMPNEDSFSFYYFRIVLKTDDEVILPLDSNMGNNCFLDANNYCYFLLKNDYNIFSLNLSIFISEQYIYYSIFSKNIDNINSFNFSEFFSDSDNYVADPEINKYGNDYTNIKNDNRIEYVLLIIYTNVEEGTTNNILSTFYDAKKEINPNIYSSKIYKLDNIEKYAAIFSKKEYKINFCSYNGEGIVNLNNFFKNQLFTQNMLRQYYKIPLKNEITNITFQDKGDFIFYIKLNNLNISEKVRIGKTLNDFIQNEKFPLYYLIYLKEINNQYLDINFKIINLNDNPGNDTNFEIEGNIIHFDELERIKNGKPFVNVIKGEYDICTKIGFLNLPIKFNNNRQDLIALIKISGINDYNNMNTFIQILAIKDKLIIPAEQYIIKSYYPSKKLVQNETGEIISHTYFFLFFEKKNISLELHNNNQDLEIKFNIEENSKEEKENEKIKYLIDLQKQTNNALSFSIDINDNELYGKYMLKYNYIQKENEEYIFKTDNIEKKIKAGNSNLEFVFPNIQILGNNTKDNISFTIYSYLYLNDELNKTLINLLNSLIPNSIPPFSENKIIVNAKEQKFKISFKNTLKDKNEHNLIIQIKVSINKNNDPFYNKYLVYAFEQKLEKPFYLSATAIIIASMLIIIIVVMVVSFVIYCKMKKKNINLEELLRTSFKEIENKKRKEEEENSDYSYI